MKLSFLQATLAALVAFCLPPAARAAELGDFNLVACMFRTGNLELFVVNPVTGAARNLTRNPATDKYPSCSLDGKQIAFVSDREGSDALFVMNADGSNVRRLAKGQRGIAGMASWTADGKWLYFGLFGGGPPRMCCIHPDDTEFKVVGEGTDPAVSPDGKRLAFDGHGLFVMNTDGTNRRRLGEDSGYGGLHATWTPDGKSIIYADRVGTALELFSCDPDSGKKRELTKLGGAATSPSVSPDGKWISFRLCDEVYWIDGKRAERAYKERREDKRPVWIMAADGSNPQVVEPLHYKTTIDGSRAPFLKRKPSG